MNEENKTQASFSAKASFIGTASIGTAPTSTFTSNGQNVIIYVQPGGNLILNVQNMSDSPSAKQESKQDK